MEEVWEAKTFHHEKKLSQLYINQVINIEASEATQQIVEGCNQNDIQSLLYMLKIV